MRILLTVILCIFAYVVHIFPQINYISGVADHSQPPDTSVQSTIDVSNFCAPFAALNIIDYWENTAAHPAARNVTGSLPGDQVAEFIGWFMDTNDQGSPLRANGTQFSSVQGTYALDQDTGLLEYLASDSLNLHGFPYLLPKGKWRQFWFSIPSYSPQYSQYTADIDSGNPVKLDFSHWNIQSLSHTFFDPLIAPDSIYFYQWGTPVSTSDVINPENPLEFWNLEEGPENIGHAVTGVGYLSGFMLPPPLDTIPPQDYVIVHDNWDTTPENIAIPWQNVAAMFSFYLPIIPDLSVLTVHTSNDTSLGYTDSLKVGSPITIKVKVSLMNSIGIPAFILVANVLDEQGVAIATDTLSYTISISKMNTRTTAGAMDSLEVLFDSLFTPSASGTYTIESKIFWDQNNDSIINDQPDADPFNDQIMIERKIGFTIISANLNIIQGVPDINQPPTMILPSTQLMNFCAPTVAANILQFWDTVVGHSQAADVTARLSGKTTAEYIGWFFDTNNTGNPQAHNGTIYQAASGTYVADQDSFLAAYVRWDSAHTYGGSPVIPIGKKGYDWEFRTDFQQGFPFVQTEIDSGYPVKVDFTHWNISFSGSLMVDPVTQDTAFLYNWGTAVQQSGQVDQEAPEEVWNLDEGLSNIGHAVTAVGYATGTQDYIIVHDNWAITPKKIAISWGNWVVSMAMNPPMIPSEVKQKLRTPRHYYLAQNYPNPFNPFTMINYQLPVTNYVDLSVYNLLGQKMVTLVSGKQEAGHHQVEWDASGFAAGIYFYKIKAGEFEDIKKMILLR